MKSYNRIMEIFWIVLAILTAMASIFLFWKFGFDKNWYLLVISGMSLVQWFLRYQYRKKQEKEQNDKP